MLFTEIPCTRVIACWSMLDRLFSYRCRTHCAAPMILQSMLELKVGWCQMRCQFTTLIRWNLTPPAFTSVPQNFALEMKPRSFVHSRLGNILKLQKHPNCLVCQSDKFRGRFIVKRGMELATQFMPMVSRKNSAISRLLATKQSRIKLLLHLNKDCVCRRVVQDRATVRFSLEFIPPNQEIVLAFKLVIGPEGKVNLI